MILIRPSNVEWILQKMFCIFHGKRNYIIVTQHQTFHPTKHQTFTTTHKKGYRKSIDSNAISLVACRINTVNESNYKCANRCTRTMLYMRFIPLLRPGVAILEREPWLGGHWPWPRRHALPTAKTWRKYFNCFMLKWTFRCGIVQGRLEGFAGPRGKVKSRTPTSKITHSWFFQTIFFFFWKVFYERCGRNSEESTLCWWLCAMSKIMSEVNKWEFLRSANLLFNGFKKYFCFVCRLRFFFIWWRFEYNFFTKWSQVYKISVIFQLAIGPYGNIYIFRLN